MFKEKEEFGLNERLYQKKKNKFKKLVKFFSFY